MAQNKRKQKKKRKLYEAKLLSGRSLSDISNLMQEAKRSIEKEREFQKESVEEDHQMIIKSGFRRFETEERFFEFVKRRTNNFEYFLEDTYGFVEAHTGRRGEFNQPLRDSEDISFYIRFRDIQLEANKNRGYLSEEEYLQKTIEEISNKPNKDLEEQTLEKLMRCRLQYLSNT